MVMHLYCAVLEINMKPHNKYMVANITTQLYTNRLLSVINKRILLQGHGKLTSILNMKIRQGSRGGCFLDTTPPHREQAVAEFQACIQKLELYTS